MAIENEQPEKPLKMHVVVLDGATARLHKAKYDAGRLSVDPEETEGNPPGFTGERFAASDRIKAITPEQLAAFQNARPPNALSDEDQDDPKKQIQYNKDFAAYRRLEADVLGAAWPDNEEELEKLKNLRHNANIDGNLAGVAAKNNQIAEEEAGEDVKKQYQSQMGPQYRGRDVDDPDARAKNEKWLEDDGWLGAAIAQNKFVQSTFEIAGRSAAWLAKMNILNARDRGGRVAPDAEQREANVQGFMDNLEQKYASATDLLKNDNANGLFKPASLGDPNTVVMKPPKGMVYVGVDTNEEGQQVAIFALSSITTQGGRKVGGIPEDLQLGKGISPVEGGNGNRVAITVPEGKSLRFSMQQRLTNATNALRGALSEQAIAQRVQQVENLVAQAQNGELTPESKKQAIAALRGSGISQQGGLHSDHNQPWNPGITNRVAATPAVSSRTAGS